MSQLSTHGPTRMSAAKRTRTIVSRKTPSGRTYRKYRGSSVQIRMGRQVFPRQLFNTLKYAETTAVSVVAGTAQYLFRANGLYDPNYTGTGHQPLYYDQLTPIYNHWVVLRSRIALTVCGPSSDGTGVTAAIYLDDDTSVAANMSQALENPTCRYKVFQPAANGVVSLYNTYDAKKMYGGDPQSKLELLGTATTDPNEQALFVCLIDAQSGGSSTWRVNVVIEYDIVWDELKTIAQS